MKIIALQAENKTRAILREILASIETLNDIERLQEEAIREGIKEIDRNLAMAREDGHLKETNK